MGSFFWNTAMNSQIFQDRDQILWLMPQRPELTEFCFFSFQNFPSSTPGKGIFAWVESTYFWFLNIQYIKKSHKSDAYYFLSELPCSWLYIYMCNILLIYLGYTFVFWLYKYILAIHLYMQCRRSGFNPWVGKIPWRREQIPTPVFWPGEFHGLYIPWGCKESDTTEWFSLHWLYIYLSFKQTYLWESLSDPVWIDVPSSLISWFDIYFSDSLFNKSFGLKDIYPTTLLENMSLSYWNDPSLLTPLI